MARIMAKTQLCKTCGGDGYSDLWDDNVCGVCGGSGEVPAFWWWDDEGTLHKVPPPGPSNILVTTPNPLPFPKDVKKQ